jgi:hypothetical protein
MPVRPPSRMPTADSANTVSGEVPSREPITMAAPSVTCGEGGPGGGGGARGVGARAGAVEAVESVVQSQQSRGEQAVLWLLLHGGAAAARGKHWRTSCPWPGRLLASHAFSAMRKNPPPSSHPPVPTPCRPAFDPSILPPAILRLKLCPHHLVSH